jgi:iron(III) transport system substrate-binding protein
VIDDSIGLVAGAKSPDEARAFIDWVGTRETLLLTAREAFRLPARMDLPSGELPLWAQEAREQIIRADLDWVLVAKRGAEWMALWDREVRGRG